MRPGKRISDFRQKSKDGRFQIKKGRTKLCPGRRSANTRSRSYKDARQVIFVYKSARNQPERYMLNMRFPPQSRLIVFTCSEKGWISFRWWRRKRFFIKLYLITVIWNKRGWTDWSFQATVTGLHLWDNIQTAISPWCIALIKRAIYLCQTRLVPTIKKKRGPIEIRALINPPSQFNKVSALRSEFLWWTEVFDMETSSDPPHFSAFLPLGKQQRPISAWGENIYLEIHGSVRMRKQEHFIP